MDVGARLEGDLELKCAVYGIFYLLQDVFLEMGFDEVHVSLFWILIQDTPSDLAFSQSRLCHLDHVILMLGTVTGWHCDSLSTPCLECGAQDCTFFFVQFLSRGNVLLHRPLP